MINSVSPEVVGTAIDVTGVLCDTGAEVLGACGLLRDPSEHQFTPAVVKSMNAAMRKTFFS